MTSFSVRCLNQASNCLRNVRIWLLISFSKNLRIKRKLRNQQEKKFRSRSLIKTKLKMFSRCLQLFLLRYQRRNLLKSLKILRSSKSSSPRLARSKLWWFSEKISSRCLTSSVRLASTKKNSKLSTNAASWPLRYHLCMLWSTSPSS